MNIRYPDSGVVDEPIAVVCHLVSLVTSGGLTLSLRLR
jgi:hypothetical protein